MSASTDEIAQAILNYVNTCPALSGGVVLSMLGPENGAIALQPQPTPKKLEEYIDGSSVRQLSFALSLRIGGDDTKARLEAIGRLNALGDWLDAQTEADTLPDIGTGRACTEMTMTLTPAIVYRDESGFEEWQAIYQTTYEQEAA